MSENQVKDRIAEELRKAEKAGQITTKRVRGIIEEAVFDAVKESKEGVKEAIESGQDVKETVTRIAGDATKKAWEKVGGHCKGCGFRNVERDKGCFKER